MSSDATIAHVDTAVQQVLAYVSPNTGKKAALLCGNRVYNGHGGKYRDPETAQFPHVTLLKINVRSDDQVDVQENFDIEALCHARGRNRAAEAEALADFITQALLTWRESSNHAGHTRGRGYTRATLPPVEGADRMADVTTVRVTVGCSSFPKLVTAAVG